MKQSTKYKASHLSLYQVLSQHFVTKKILFGTCLTSTFCCILYGNFFPRFHNYNMLGHCSIDLPTYVLVTLNGSSPTKRVSMKESTKYKVVIYRIICTMFSPWVNEVQRFSSSSSIRRRSESYYFFRCCPVLKRLRLGSNLNQAIKAIFESRWKSSDQVSEGNNQAINFSLIRNQILVSNASADDMWLLYPYTLFLAWKLWEL